ncbi:MAG: hypothetical protein H7125_04345 [Proteobacteria bacterium]|nr:hypothetical protein [Burkholderiales bacterium]
MPIVQGRKGFNALDLLEPISLMSTSTWVLVAHPSLPVKSVKDMDALAKAHRGKLDYASGGIGGSHHVVMESFKSVTGTHLVHVPYRGASAALTAVESGEMPVMFSAMQPALDRIQSNRLIPLAVATPERSKLLPNVATISESGVPGFTFATWTGILAPKGTPPAIITRLNGEIPRALTDSGVVAKLAALGGTPQPTSPKALAALIEDTTVRMAKVIEQAKIKAE